MSDVTLVLEEAERQLVLLALAGLSIRSPGFDYALNRLALRIDNDEAGRASMYDDFRNLSEPGQRDWKDATLPEDAAIDAAFPTRSGRHDLYLEAMRLVGARQSKGALVALVNWLLHRADPSEVRP